MSTAGAAVASVSENASVSRKALAGGLLWVAILGFIKILILFFYANRFGFMADELYFLDCARHPAWGYADLPPLLPWITWVAMHTIGASLWAVRVYPAIAAGATVVLAGWLAAELGGKKRAVILASFFVFLDPVSFAFGHILSTNALDLPLWLLCVILLVKLEKGASPRLWIWWGAVAGLALMHKYILAFLLAGLLVGFLFTSWRRWFANRWLWAGVGTMLLIVLPNVVWQATHEFPFLQLQHFNRIHHRNVNLPPMQFLGAQAVLHNPLNLVFALCGVVFLFSPATRRFRALAWTFIAFIVLMFALHARDYYLAAAFPPMFVAGAVAVERWLPGRWAARGVYAYTALAALLTALALPSILPILSPAATEAYCQRMWLQRAEPETSRHAVMPDWVADQFGWQESVEMVAAYYNSLPPEERAKTAILGNYYGQAGAIDYYGPALGLPQAISGHHSYWFWGSRAYTGESVIVMDPWPDSAKHCSSWTLVGKPQIPWAPPDRHPAIYHCRGLDFNLSAEWQRFRHFD